MNRENDIRLRNPGFVVIRSQSLFFDHVQVSVNFSPAPSLFPTPARLRRYDSPGAPRGTCQYCGKIFHPPPHPSFAVPQSPFAPRPSTFPSRSRRKSLRTTVGVVRVYRASAPQLICIHPASAILHRRILGDRTANSRGDFPHLRRSRPFRPRNSAFAIEFRFLPLAAERFNQFPGGCVERGVGAVRRRI